MTAAARYDSANIAANVAAAGTSLAVRKRDEREGCARRALTDACIEADAVLCTTAWRSLDGDHFRVIVTLMTSSLEITETGPDPVELLDRARDRLNREDWDQ